MNFRASRESMHILPGTTIHAEGFRTANTGNTRVQLSIQPSIRKKEHKGKKSPEPPKRMPKQGILVADHWGPSFSSLGVFCMCLRVRFFKLFTRNDQLGGPSGNIQGDSKINNNISVLFSVGFEGRWWFSAELKINKCFNFPFLWQLRLLTEAKTGSGKDGCHRKEVPQTAQKNAQTRNFGCRHLGAFVFKFGGIWAVTGALFRDGCDY